MSGGHARGGDRVYEPVADIAEGGMGRIELVVRRERRFARIYAMKRLRRELSEDREVREMFLEEARIAGLIRHPNVVPVLDVGEDDEGPFLVMELVEGVAAYRALAEAAAEGRRLEVAFCVEVVRQSAHGLAAAHELEGAGGRDLCVIHRDVSPQNILLGFDGLVRLTDFGVARALDNRPDEWSVTGKVGYMSPEQVRGLELDERSDLFSLGIVLYELLAGERLYPGEREQSFERILHEPVPDVREVRDDVPEALAELVDELLQKSPDDRPASASLVAARLDAIAEGLRDSGRSASLALHLRTVFAGERERQRSLVAAALERTEYDLSLLAPDLEDGEPPTTERPSSAAKAEGPTAPLPATPRRSSPDTVVSAAGPRRHRTPWIVGAVAVAALGAVAILVAALIGPDDDAEGPSPGPSPRCDDASCRATHGAMYSCDPDGAACASPISPVCPEVFPQDASDDPEAIVIGTIFDRSTPNQLARENAARLAVDGLNRAGGIDGRRVLLVHCDTSAAPATEAAGRLVRAGAPAIIGPSSSSDTAAVFSTYAAEGVLVISPSATATQLGRIDRGTPGRLWRTAPPDSLQAAVIMRELTRDPSASSLVVVRRSNDVYAQSLSVIVQEAAAQRGLSVAPSRLFVDTGAVAEATSEAADDAPGAVLFLSSHVEDAAAFLDAASEHAAFDGVPLVLADASANEDLVSLTGPGASRFGQVRATRPAPPSTIITSELASEYASMFGGEDPLHHSFTAHAYDATALVLVGAGYALGNGGSLTGGRIAEGIALASSGTVEHRLLSANFAAIITALRSEAPDVDVVGASGPLDYDPDTGELTTATYEVLGVQGDPPHLTVLEVVRAPLPGG